MKERGSEMTENWNNEKDKEQEFFFKLLMVTTINGIISVSVEGKPI